MRTDLLLAGGLAALVVGGVAYIGKRTQAAAIVPGMYPAFSTSELYLRAAPEHGAELLAIVPPGRDVRVDATAAPGWLYVYHREPNGGLVEGYSRAENLSGLDEILPVLV